VLTRVVMSFAALALLVEPINAGAGSSRPDLAKIDAYLQAQVDSSRIPGLAVGIVQGEHIVHLQGFGKADDAGRAVTPQTPFFIGSITKSFTALAVMQLVEAGKVQLDAPIQQYLSWFRVADPAASALISVRQLLNQTSGFSTNSGRDALVGSEAETLEQAVRNLRTAKLASPAGTSYNYSNANYMILGLLIQIVSNEPYEEYIQQHIFQPLGMGHSYTSPEAARQAGLATGYRYWFGLPVAFDAPYLAATLPAGLLISTVEDMSHYLSMYLSGGKYNGIVVLSAEGIAEMERPAPQSGSARYGMGWTLGTLGGVKVIWHSGDEPNFHAGMYLVPEGNWAVIVLENVNSSNPVATSQVQAPEAGVTRLVAGGQAPDATGFATGYVVFDLVVAITIAVQIWSLVRLMRRRSRPELPMGGLSHLESSGPLWLLPLVWELGIPAAIWFAIPQQADASWGVVWLFAPDLTAASIAIAGLFLLTGAVRLAIMSSRPHYRQAEILRTGST
jgi:CubicO group peptidase (beta-lactamase class C family)